MMDPQVQRMLREFAELKKKVNRLEKGERPDQDNHTSWEGVGINNYDPTTGKIRQRVGVQSDGAFAVLYANGPKPTTPSGPNVSARELGAVIGWDGTFAGGVPRPSDVQRIDVHVAETPGFIPDGTTVVGSMLGEGSVGVLMDYQTHYVKLVAVTTSDVASDPSEEIAVKPLPATSLAVTDTVLIEPGGRLVAGEPEGARSQFGASGFEQYDEDGDRTVNFGANPASGNTLTVSGQVSETRTNLCDNPKLDSNASGWTGGSAVLTRISGMNVGTEWCYRMSPDGGVYPHVGFGLRGLGGKRVAAQFTVNAANLAGSQVRLAWEWTEPDGTVHSAVVLNEQPCTETTVLTGVFDAPDNAVYVHPHLNVDDTATGFIDVSLCCVEVADVARDYFDGDTVVSFARGNSLVNPGFENGVEAWTATGCTLAQSTAQAVSGVYSGAMVPNTGVETAFIESNPSEVIAGSEVTAGVWVWLSIAGEYQTRLRFYDENHELLAEETLPVRTPTPQVWAFYQTSVAAPEGSEFVSLAPSLVNSPGSGQTAHFDSLELNIPDPDQTSVAEWSATPGNSVSTLVTPPTTTRRNLCPNPKLDNNTSGWYTFGDLSGGTRVVDSAGTSSTAYRATWDTTGMARGDLGFSGMNISELVGGWITVSMDCRWLDSVNVSSWLWMQINFTNADGAVVHTASSERVWAEYDVENRFLIRTEVPASVAWCDVFVTNWRALSSTSNSDHDAGGQLEVSRLMFEATEENTEYFDGDTADSQWTGDPGNSTSVMITTEQFVRQTLASLSDQGTLSVRDLTTGGLSVEGRDFREYLDPLPAGFVAWGQPAETSSEHTTADMGWFELGFTAMPGRTYRIQSTTIRTLGGTQSSVYLRFTDDGTAPTISSEILANAYAGASQEAIISYIWEYGQELKQVRMLVAIHVPNGVESWLSTPVAAGVRLWVEDIGGSLENTATLSTGSGGVPDPVDPPPEPKQHYNTTWRARASQCFNRHGVRGTNIAYQGFYPDGWNGDNKTQFGFDSARIRSDLAGATIDSVAVYLYAQHWYYNSGGEAVWGYSGDSYVRDGSYNIADWGIQYSHLGKPQGKWCALPKWVGEGFRDGWIESLNLDSAFLGHNLKYYGVFNWQVTLGIQYWK